jgi:hypothetical protein
LVEFYNSTNGPSWTSDANWLTGPLATWEGVTVTGDRVTGLSLPFNNLTGSLPYHIGFLQKLTFLSLPGNNLTGEIPSAILFLNQLTELNLSENQLTGGIPSLLGLNLKLQTINLSENSLSGSIPASIGLLQKLMYLNLSANQLTGSIPSSIGLLKKLQILFLSENQLTGSIPSTFGQLRQAVEIYLFNNLLKGAIPSSIGNLDSLVWLNVSNNDLTGAVPATVTNMGKLFSLNVSGNELSTLPNVATMTTLGQLRVRDNRFTFEDLEPNKPKLSSSAFYVPQDSVGSVETVSLCAGDTLRLTANFTGGLANNRYRWLTVGGGFSTPTTADPVLTIVNVQPENSGTYFARCTNTVVTGLTIIRRPVQVTVAACASSPAVVETLKAYPTEFDNETTVSVTTTNEEDLSLAIIDGDGMVVETVEGLKTNQDVKVGQNLGRGLHYLQATHAGKRHVTRIIKN